MGFWVLHIKANGIRVMSVIDKVHWLIISLATRVIRNARHTIQQVITPLSQVPERVGSILKGRQRLRISTSCLLDTFMVILLDGMV